MASWDETQGLGGEPSSPVAETVHIVVADDCHHLAKWAGLHCETCASQRMRGIVPETMPEEWFW